MNLFYSVNTEDYDDLYSININDLVLINKKKIPLPPVLPNKNNSKINIIRYKTKYKNFDEYKKIYKKREKKKRYKKNKKNQKN